MKSIHKAWYLVTALIVFMVPKNLTATVIAKGNGTGNLTFSAPVTAKTYDRFNRRLFVGLGLSSATGTNYAISYFDAASGSTVPLATAWNPSSSTANRIAFMTLVTSQGEPLPDLAFVPGTLTTTPDLTGKRVHVITANNTYLTLPADLLDAANAPTSGVCALSADASQIYAAVKPTNSTSYFGENNSGIAVVAFNPEHDAIAQTNVTRLDVSIDQIKIMNAPTFTQPSATTPNNVTLSWNEALQRLYVGLDLSTAAGAGNGAIAIVMGIPTNNGLDLSLFADKAAFSSTNDTNIIGAIANNATPKRIGIKHMRPMNTTAGPNYLIVNGGNNAPGNTIFALPLVNLNDQTNMIQGMIADEASFNTTTKHFEQPATTNATLANTSNPAILVGQGALPLETNQKISDLVVVDDCVYVSIDVPQSPNNEPGIFYSQALFDAQGKITFWTPWSKRAFPVDGFPAQTTANQGRISFFDVDAVNGKLWAISNAPASLVATTTWNFGNDAGTQDPTTLVGALNNALSDGCFSVLDLDNNTRDFTTNNTSYRYALFGGHNRVVFSLISQQIGAADFSQKLTTNFSLPQHFLVKELPDNPGCVSCLAYSQQIPAKVNYFFAGTPNGLYVFSNRDGSGFLTTSLEELNQAPFSTGVWQKISGINGTIVALKSSSNNENGMLYVVTMQENGQNIFNCTVYGIPYQNSVNAMFASSNIRILAQSNTTTPNSDLGATTVFFGIENVSNLEKEQLILATNNGIYASHADVTMPKLGILSALNQNDARWEQVPHTEKGLYSGVYAPIASPITTTWPIECIAGSCNFFNQNTIRQLSSFIEPSIYGFSPFNDTAIGGSAVYSIDTILNMWSDGGRRLFIIKRMSDPGTTKLLVLPYNLLEWGIVSPLKPEPALDSLIIVEAPLNTIHTSYWTQQIGLTGMLLMGTNHGVMALS